MWDFFSLGNNLKLKYAMYLGSMTDSKIFSLHRVYCSQRHEELFHI